jgi:hypothetical protein
LLVFSDEMDELRGDLKNRFVINDDGRSVREELSLLAYLVSRFKIRLCTISNSHSVY